MMLDNENFAQFKRENSENEDMMGTGGLRYRKKMAPN